MTHPSGEQWMAYLYGEVDGKSKAALAKHLQSCPDCQKQMAAWRGAMTQLDAWQLPPTRSRLGPLRPLVKWAVAAVLLLGVGYGLGQFRSQRAADTEALRAQVEASVRSCESSINKTLRRELTEALAAERSRLQADLVHELHERLAAEMEQLIALVVLATREENRCLLAALAERHELARIEDRQLVAELVRRLESRRIADHVALRTDLEVLAALTGEEFLRTEQGIVELLTQAVPVRGVSEVQDHSHTPNQRSPK